MCGNRRPRATLNKHMESCVGALASSAREELLSRGAAAATHSALVPPPASIEVAKRFGLFGAIGSAAGSELLGWCPDEGQKLRRHLLAMREKDPSGVIIDVGSFDGSDAINFAQSSRHRVWTFEPAPTKHAGIRNHLRDKGVAENVTLFPMALSNRSGVAQFELMPPTGPRGRAFVGGGSNALGSAQDLLIQDDRPKGLPTRESKRVVEVPICQLDALLPPPHRVSYLKIDAQGFDTLVLRGAAELLAQRRISALAFEFTPFLMPGRSAEARSALEWLESLGYACVPCWRAHQAPAGHQARGAWPIARYVDHFRNRSLWDDVACRPLETLATCGAVGGRRAPFDQALCGGG